MKILIYDLNIKKKLETYKTYFKETILPGKI